MPGAGGRGETTVGPKVNASRQQSLLLHAFLRNASDASVVLCQGLREEAGRIRVGRRRGVGVGQQGLHRGQDRAHIVDGGPLVLDDVHAQRAIRLPGDA